MKFPKTIYVTRTIEDEGTEDECTEYFVDTKQSVVEKESEDTEVAVYQLVKVGAVKKSSRIVFE